MTELTLDEITIKASKIHQRLFPQRNFYKLSPSTDFYNELMKLAEEYLIMENKLKV